MALLSKVATLSLDEKQVFLGQFGRHGDEGGYLDDETVPAGSRCPTFASLVLQVSRTCLAGCVSCCGGELWSAGCTLP